MRRTFFFIVAVCLATPSFASIPPASARDVSSPSFDALSETRIRVSEDLAPFERPAPSLLSRALRQGYEQASTTNASGLAGFLSVDPVLDIDKAQREPQRWNRYSYVMNNPLRYVDPDGREAIPGELAAFDTSLGANSVWGSVIKPLLRLETFRDAVAGWGSASGKERAMAAAVVGIALLDVGSNAIAPEKGAAIQGGTKLLGAAKLMDHHLLPQQFQKFFADAGININKFTVTLTEAAHLRGMHGSGLGGLPGGWNKAWAQWIKDNPKATAKDIYQHLGRMMDEYRLNKLEIHEYRK